MSTVVFAGTAGFSLPILATLAQHHDVVRVFSQPDKPVGRKQKLVPTPVRALCKELSLVCAQPEKIEDDAFWKDPVPFDFLISAAYGQIIPEKLLRVAQKDNLNVHGSLLPAYRGASPVQHALLAGDSVTGVSIMRMVKKMDAGPVFLQQEVEILYTDTAETLFETLSHTGANLLLKTLENYDSIHPLQQDESLATYCKKIVREDGKIQWLHTAEQIYRMWRAYTPWPGIYTLFKGKRLRLLRVSCLEDVSCDGAVGEVIKKDDGLHVVCGSGCLKILELQLEGRATAAPPDFERGYGDFVGSRLH